MENPVKIRDEYVLVPQAEVGPAYSVQVANYEGEQVAILASAGLTMLAQRRMTQLGLLAAGQRSW
ncbi:hypothetical protein K0651_12790 [Ornithinimicrobium sp. Arc0846-15]|nr:hypothetical protein [Ornithinimicrobium laminariae]